MAQVATLGRFPSEFAGNHPRRIALFVLVARGPNSHAFFACEEMELLPTLYQPAMSVTLADHRNDGVVRPHWFERQQSSKQGFDRR